MGFWAEDLEEKVRGGKVQKWEGSGLGWELYDDAGWRMKRMGGRVSIVTEFRKS